MKWGGGAPDIVIYKKVKSTNLFYFESEHIVKKKKRIKNKNITKQGFKLGKPICVLLFSYRY